MKHMLGQRYFSRLRFLLIFIFSLYLAFGVLHTIERSADPQHDESHCTFCLTTHFIAKSDAPSNGLILSLVLLSIVAPKYLRITTTHTFSGRLDRAPPA